MPASQTTKPHELSQGSRQSPAILQHLLLTICESPRQRHNTGQQTLAFYVDDTQILLETHRHEQTVEETPASPQ
jgi:hypothetical protein